MSYPVGLPCLDCGAPVGRDPNGNVLRRCTPCNKTWRANPKPSTRVPCAKCGHKTQATRTLCRNCDVTVDIGAALISASSRMDEAACIGMAEIFTSEIRADHQVARQICAHCPVLAECGQLTRQMLRHGPIAGTWAGHGYGIFKTDRGAA